MGELLKSIVAFGCLAIMLLGSLVAVFILGMSAWDFAAGVVR